MRVASRRAAVGFVVDQFGLSERRSCALVGIDRTSCRYVARRASDEPLRARLVELAKERPRWGYRTLWEILRREQVVNPKKVHPRNQSRFSFTKGGERWISGVAALEIRFEEDARPTVVTTSSGDSLPAHGSFWIDSSRGAVLRSEAVFRFEPSLAEAAVETDYRLEPTLRVWVPFEMKEHYRNLPHASRSVFGAPTEATARYSNFRQFRVTVEEGEARVESP